MNLGGQDESKQARECEARFRQMLWTIRDIGQLTLEEDDPGRLMHKACANLVKTMGYASAWVVLLDEKHEKATHIATSGVGSDFETMRKHLKEVEFPDCLKQVLAQDDIVVVANSEEDCPGCPLAAECSVCSLMLYPLGFGERIQGLLAVAMPASCTENKLERELLARVAGDLDLSPIQR